MERIQIFFSFEIYTQESKKVRKILRNQIQKKKKYLKKQHRISLRPPANLAFSWLHGERRTWSLCKEERENWKVASVQGPWSATPSAKGWNRKHSTYLLKEMMREFLFRFSIQEEVKNGLSWELFTTALPLCGFEV